MIILVNGAYGCGKSTVADLLVRELPSGLLFDPEEIGYMMSAVLKGSRHEPDFRNVPFLEVPLWRRLVPVVAAEMQQQYKANLVIPMTMYHPQYFQEVLEALRQVDQNIHHFCLVAPVEVIHERLRQRGEQQEGDWAFQQTKPCVEALESSVFEEKIDTVQRTPEQILQCILGKVSS